jgi:hypothetical protein
MIAARMALVAALLIATPLMAQQNNPTAPSNPAAPHTPLTPNQTECWDAAANRARNPEVADKGPSATEKRPVPTTLPSTTTRPPGMNNC